MSIRSASAAPDGMVVRLRGSPTRTRLFTLHTSWHDLDYYYSWRFNCLQPNCAEFFGGHGIGMAGRKGMVFCTHTRKPTELGKNCGGGWLVAIIIFISLLA
jgi:hypothetical protein